MQYITQAVATLIDNYSGKLPLTHYLKQYFKAHPKLGSRDRRAISDAVYTYYRVARFIPRSADTQIWNIIREGYTRCRVQNPFLEKVLNTLPVAELQWNTRISLDQLAISPGIEADAWKASMLTQPRLFIRLRKNRHKILSTLTEKQIAFEAIGTDTLALTNSTQIDKLLAPEDYVIQDYSSQHSLDLLLEQAPVYNKAISVWDTCSGAGGKMLLLKDRYPAAAVLSTDIRPSILHNLRERAKLYGHRNVRTQVVDSSQAEAVEKAITEVYDWVISDVPCSGSGTWARTPEQFYFFQPEDLEHFSRLQWSIVRNTCRKVKPGGYFLYITCSVFQAENEDIVAKLLHTYPDMQLLSNRLLNGISVLGDSMYAALLQRKA